MSLPDVPPFYAIEISRQAHRIAQEGKSVLHMEFGQPSAGAPRAAIQAAHDALESEVLGYWTSTVLRERLALHYAVQYGVSVAPAQILLTNGASGALVLAFTSLLAPGDRVAMTRPGYAPYRNALTALHLVPVEIPCGAETGYRLLPESIADLNPAPKALIIASPANPTGTMMSESDMRQIIHICAERDILLISDEIYHGLSYGKKANSVLEFSCEAIVVNSFSKYYCMPGWRLGWMVVPEQIATQLDTISGNLFLTPSALAQFAAIAALDAEDELDQHLQAYQHNRSHIIEVLRQHGVTNIAPPDGAFYIYADIGHITNDSLGFCKQLVEATGLAIAPGIDFDPENGNRFIRFSFAVSEAECIDAMVRFANFVSQ
jgi:aspartate/methionine/tyrosine aminotransferase